MTTALPEPTDADGDIAGRFLDYFDYFRAVIARKLEGLDDTELRSTRLPSGWTPLQLLHHLVHMERRWIRWGFLGEQVSEPWGDADTAGGWAVDDNTSLETLVAALHEGGSQTRRIVEGAELTARASTRGRFADADGTPPTLGWILLHVLQEYARHAGHADIVRELIDGEVGE